MNLALYSDEKKVPNPQLDRKVLELAPRNPRFTYIPSSGVPLMRYYDSTVAYFSKYGISQFSLLNLATNNHHDISKIITKSDIVYLSGGNTFEFLLLVQKHNLKGHLDNFLQKGGLLIGISAGSMIMTPTILATYLFHKNKNDVENICPKELVDLNGLGYTNFEFIPHYENSAKEEFLSKYLDVSKNDIYAVNDGGGIVISDEVIETFGEVFFYPHNAD